MYSVVGTECALREFGDEHALINLGIVIDSRQSRPSARRTDRLRFYRICTISPQTTRPSSSLRRTILEAVSPEEGLSNTKANDDGDDKTELERPEAYRRMGWSSSSPFNTRNELT